MNEVLQKFLLVIVSIFLFSSVGSLIPANAVSKDTQNSRVTVKTKLKGVTQSDIERVKKEAEKALQYIPPILGIEYDKDIKIVIVDKGICRLKRGVVTLPIKHVRKRAASIVQLIAIKMFRNSLSEGFTRVGIGVFLQEKFGEDKGYPAYFNAPNHLSLHGLVIWQRDNLYPLFYLKHKKKRYWEREARGLAFIETGSFISFLYEKYGDQKFKNLYKSNVTGDFENFYGKSIQELENEWLNYVFVELPAKEPSIQYSMGLLEDSVEESVYWFSLAADNGHLDAQKKLGDMYKGGKQVPQNYQEAIKWYTLAAKQGDKTSQKKLGDCYLESDKDYVRAYAWLCIATDQGSNMARKKRDEIAKKMTPEQIASANELIKEIKAR